MLFSFFIGFVGLSKDMKIKINPDSLNDVIK
jgi:hypothetical protein